MLTTLFFPHLTGLRVDRAWREDALVHLAVRTTRRAARCPLCQRLSRRVHSHYERQLADLPTAGDPVRVHLRVRRFVCRVRWCRRKIFAERVAALTTPFARRTTRLRTQLLRVAFTVGGEEGARHATADGAPVSARTLLRLVRATPPAAPEAVRILGVDDWARRKGRRYGTILVNLETHRVIDLLPDRTAGTLAAWLVQHPEIEVVSRDRAGAYAEGIRQGALQAIQVADRFHLRKNATDALERYLTRQHAAVRQAASLADETPTPFAEDSPAGAALPPTPLPQPLTEAQVQRRAHRLARYDEVVTLRAAGATIETIAHRVRISPRTVKRWLQAGTFPERQRRRERPGQVAPYAAYLQVRWQQGCQNATRLYQELQAHGYQGGDGSVAAWVTSWRASTYRYRGRVTSRRYDARRSSPYTPRQVCWLLQRAEDDLTIEERTYLTHLYHLCPRIALAQALVEEFSTVLRDHDVEGLYTWLRRAETSGVTEIAGLARSIWLDRQAVEAAVSVPWSNGQVEGKINKLKLLKRRAYGRSSFDLLRLQVLHAA